LRRHVVETRANGSMRTHYPGRSRDPAWRFRRVRPSVSALTRNGIGFDSAKDTGCPSKKKNLKSQSRPNRLVPAFGVRSNSILRKADSTQALPPRPTRSAPVFDQLQGQRPNEPPWLPQSRWASGTRSKRRRWAGTCPALRGWSRRPNACTVPVSAAAPPRTQPSKNLRISLALSTRIARRRSTLQIPQRLYQKKKDKRK
jgi:hypothetical protein